MIYCRGVPGLISPTASVYYMAAAIRNEWCQNQTEPVLLVVGAICSADDRRWLPACADFTPFMCFYVFCCSVWYGGKWEYPFCTICSVFVSPKCSDRLTCAQTSVISLNWMERCPQEFMPASGTDLGDTIQKLRVQKLFHLILVWLCLSWDCSPPSKHIHSREEQVWRQLPMEFIAQIEVLCMQK